MPIDIPFYKTLNALYNKNNPGWPENKKKVRLFSVMKLITESPEHHFLTTLESLRQDAGGWLGMHFRLSERLEHGDVIGKPEYIKGKIFKLQKEAEAIVKDIQTGGGMVAGASLYLFADGDIVLLARPEDEAMRKSLRALYKNIAEKAGEELSGFSDMTKDVYDYQKIADRRLLGVKRMAAYDAMADTNRVASIGLRRQRRDDALVLIVDDDRFIASYAANILNKEYEMVLARNGEEAVSYYIEYAPDITFADIHLPGLSGHDTLRAIRAVDPESFVVMLSVDTAKENVVNAGAAGASGFLKKPFSKERLLHIVQNSPFVKGRTRKGR